MTSDGGSDSYTYNANNLMTSATQSGVTTNLTYDAENRLLSVAKNGTTTKFLYDGTDSLVDYDGSGNVLRVYVHGPGDDEPLVSYDVTNGWAKSYLHADDNGSIDLITHDGGGQAQINTYDAYGLPGSGNTGRFQYTGQAWVPEIGMYYYKARLYNPVIGRFMQTDPIGYGDGMNWYNYVHGDPVNGRDPTGTLSYVVCSNPGHTFQGPDTPDPDHPGATIGNAGYQAPGGCQLVDAQADNSSPGDTSSSPGSGGVPNASNPNQPNSCHATPLQLENSGKVSFAYGEVSISAGGTSGDAWGTFMTTSGYSGKFHTYFDGGYIGAGLSIGAGSGVSKNLSTFKGVNYNLVGNLLVLAFSDNYDPQSGEHVGETNGAAVLSIGLGYTRSNTTFLSLYCPVKKQ